MQFYLITLLGLGVFTRPTKVVMAIDTSQRLSKKDISQVLDFAKSSLKPYNLSSSNVEVVLLSYGKDVNLIKASLQKSEDLEAIFDTFPEVGGRQNIPGLIEFVNNNLFKNKNSDKKKVLIMTAYGEPNLKALSPKTLKDLKEKKVEVLSLAIGSVDPERFISVCPPSNVVSVDDIEDLPEKIGELEKKTKGVIGSYIWFAFIDLLSQGTIQTWFHSFYTFIRNIPASKLDTEAHPFLQFLITNRMRIS